MAAVETKRCSHCKDPKPYDAFYWADKAHTKRQNCCKVCSHASSTKWAQVHADQKCSVERDRQLMRLYGMTREDYNALLVKQEGRCALCGQPETAKRWGKPMTLAVDHDHETKEIRGLLCSRCNRSLGFYEAYRAEIQGYLKEA
jgi:hypothetical protein